MSLAGRTTLLLQRQREPWVALKSRDPDNNCESDDWNTRSDAGREKYSCDENTAWFERNSCRDSVSNADCVAWNLSIWKCVACIDLQRDNWVESVAAAAVVEWIIPKRDEEDSPFQSHQHNPVN